MKADTKMCKLKEADWDESKEDIRSRVRDARHICKKCFRTAGDPALLCKPKKIR